MIDDMGTILDKNQNDVLPKTSNRTREEILMKIEELCLEDNFTYIGDFEELEFDESGTRITLKEFANWLFQ